MASDLASRYKVKVEVKAAGASAVGVRNRAGPGWTRVSNE